MHDGPECARIDLRLVVTKECQPELDGSACTDHAKEVPCHVDMTIASDCVLAGPTTLYVSERLVSRLRV
jgi:hypothetical protein